MHHRSTGLGRLTTGDGELDRDIEVEANAPESQRRAVGRDAVGGEARSQLALRPDASDHAVAAHEPTPSVESALQHHPHTL